jgi:CheY-like chemotaxis protein
MTNPGIVAADVCPMKVVTRVVSMAKILVIDDDAGCRELLSKALARYGHESVLAANGWEGLIALDEHDSIDLVVLDLMMPGMDGGTFLRILRNDKRRRALPVVVLSAANAGDLYARVVRTGVQDFLTKASYSLDTLIDSINRNLGDRNAPASPDVVGGGAPTYHN